MSDLQIGLIVAGVVVIGGLLAFNWWQDKRIRQHMQAHLPDTDDDPLMGSALQATTKQEPTVRIADSLGEHVTEPVVPADEVDAACEAVIDLHFATPVAGQQLLEVLRDYLRPTSKPLRFFATTDQHQPTTSVHPEQQYSDIQLAILLANRQGPLTAIDWSRLWAAAQSIAEHLDATLEGPEQDAVVAQAEALDNYCASIDAQVGLQIVLQGPTPSAQVMHAVTDAGFLPYGRQTAWLADSGVPRFTLLFDGKRADEVHSASIRHLDLLLDVPNTPADTEAFSRMASVARGLAADLQAELIDDSGRPVHEHNDAVLDEQLYELYQQLERAGFTPGDARTARVFA